MTIAELLAERREEIRRIAAKHGVTSLRVFGSVAPNEARVESDLDLLIEIGPNTAPRFPGGLIVDLEALLGCKVDVVMERSLHPALRDTVLREAKPL